MARTSLSRHFKLRQHKSRKPRGNYSRRLRMESLEDRRVLAILTWVGDVDANWNSNVLLNTNWSGDVLPADTDTLIFAGAAPGALNNDTAVGNSYTLQFTASGYTIAGNGITLDNAGTDISDTAGGNAVNTPLTIAASAVDVALGIHTLGGVIGGAGGLTKLGAGTLVLSGTNTYAGATAVNAGTLRAQNGAAIPDASDVTVAAGATLELLNSETVTSFTGAAGSNLILGANTLTTTGAMAIAGVTTAGGGLTSGTSITDNNAAALNISGTSITLQAVTGIGSGDAIETSLDSVVASNTGAGAIQLSEANAITLTSITAANGNIIITVTGIGDVTAENVNAGASNVTMLLANGDLISGPADVGVADIVGNSVSLTIIAADNNYGAGAAARLELNAVTLQASILGFGSNDAFIVDTAGGLTMDGSTINANPGNEYNIRVVGGSLLSSNAPANTRDVGAHTIVLEVTGAGSTIGTAALPFEINAATTFPLGRVDATTAGGAADHIFLRDLDDDFPVGIINAGSGNVLLRAAPTDGLAGALTDANLAANNVTAANLTLTALRGIGSGNALETAVSGLSAENTTSGNIEISNSVGGPLTLLNLPPVTASFSVRNLGGGVTVSNASPLTVAANVTAAGPISLTAADSGAGDDLTVNAGITVQSTGSSVTLNAGDNASIGAGALLAALTTVTINVDSGNADVGTGGTLNVPATADIDAASATFNGNTDADTFNMAPDDDTPITVNGNDPVVAPGDVLNLDISGLTNPNLTVNGTNDGQWTFGNAASVTYTSIETVNATPALTCFGLTVQMNGPIGAANLGAADTTRVRVGGGNLVVAVDGIAMPVFTGSLGEIDNLTVLGSGDTDNLIIEEAPGGLPNFCDDVVGLADGPGGPPTAGHTSPTFTAHTGYGSADGDPAIDVHFNGGGGADQLQLALTTAHSLVYTSDSQDTGASGNVGIGSGASLTSFGTRQLGVSFEDVTSLALNGAATPNGSSLLVDASSSALGDVQSLTVSGGANLANGISEIVPDAASTSFVDTVFMQGITGLLVRGGAGPQLVDLESLDTTSSQFTQVVLDGDSLAGDAASDTVRVQSTSGLVIPVSLLAGEGDDIFEVRKTSAPATIDGIAGPVFVSPIAGSFLDEGVGNDSLFVSDTGDLTGDNVSINETTIDGITGFAAASDIDYRNIDVLDVTGTAGNDVFDTVLNSGSDLDIVRVNGSDGNDQFYLDLNTGDDLTNIVTGLVSVTLSGDGGSDVFGQTPDNAPHAVTGLPALPLPPAALEMPHFTPPAFPGVNRFKLRPSQSTAINVNGGPDNSPTAIAPTFNATQGNVFGPTFDLINLDMTDRRPAAQSDDSIVIVSTVSGFASTSDPDPGETFVPINFTTIEAINLCDQEYLTRVQMGDLYVRTTEFNDVVQFQRLSTPNLLRVRVNTQFFSLLATRKTVAYGRAGYDVIQQVNVTLPAEFHGQAGDDYLAGYTGADLISGGAGKDRIIGHEGPNELWGDNYPQEGVPFEGPGDDFDQISGGSSADNIYGQGGGDVLNAGGGDDYVAGGSGNDNLSGSFGNDRLYGNDGNDTLSGDDGDDLLSGGSGLDTLYGRAGNNVIIGGTGADNIAGGPGNDLLYDGIVTNGTSSDNSIMQGDGHDLLMQALLADWALNSVLDDLANLDLLHPHDGDADTLTGDAGFDWVSPGPEDSGDIWDFLF